MAKRTVSPAEVSALGKAALRDFRAGVREVLAERSSKGQSVHVFEGGKIRLLAASSLISRKSTPGSFSGRKKS